MILGLLERRRNRHGQMGKGGIPRSAPYKVIMGIQAMAGVIAKKFGDNYLEYGLTASLDNIAGILAIGYDA